MAKPKMIVPKTRYNQIVKKCTSLYKQHLANKYTIAKLSLEVCKMNHNGVIEKNDYLVVDFCRDTGIPYRTLQVWRREYSQVVSKLKTPLTKSIDRKSLMETMKRVTPYSPPKEVEQIYTGYVERVKNRDDGDLMEITKRLRGYAYKIQTINFNGLKSEDIKIARDYAKQISTFLNKVLNDKAPEPIIPKNRRTARRMKR